MPSAKITYKCGHTGEHSFACKYKDLDDRAEWYGNTRLCEECSAAEAEKERIANGLIISCSVNDSSSYVMIIAHGHTEPHAERLEKFGFKKQKISSVSCHEPYFCGTALCFRFDDENMKQDFQSTFEKCHAEFQEATFKKPSRELYLYFDEAFKKAKALGESKSKANSVLEKIELPELEGSEKQIAWALKVRANILATMAANEIDISIVKQFSYASTWIDRRDDRVESLRRWAEELAAKQEVKIQEKRELTAQKKKKEQKKWRMVAVNSQNIETQVKSSFLIKLPKSSNYSGMSIWFPASLVREGRHSGEVFISFNGDFEFIAKKYGNGKWNKSTVISEKKITPEELEKIFGGAVEENSILKRYEAPEEEFAHVPAIIEPVEIEADERLKR